MLLCILIVGCGVKKPPTHYAKDSISPWENEYTETKKPEQKKK